MRNLSLENGLVKESREVIKELHERFIIVELISTAESIRRDTTIFCLPRIVFEFQPKYYSWTVQRKQFPL